MNRLSVPLAVAAAAFLGCAGFVALLPWGDPCSFVTPPGECCCFIVLSPLEEHVRNAAFLVVCLLIGLVAGLLTRSHRLIAGALGPLLAYLIGHFAAHWIYRIGWPQHPIPWTSFRVLTTILVLASMATMGIIGAFISKYVRLTTASSAA
jgi:uncharacterized membrane protein YeaQ/YmgE (transglycosylase-associated protein family)